MSNSLQSHGLYNRILQATILEWVAFPSSGDRPNPGIKSRSPALQVYSLPAEPQGKPKNTGVGSLSLLQRIFPTQELNWGLLHCRQILYQLSYQRSPVTSRNLQKHALDCMYFLLDQNHVYTDLPPYLFGAASQSYLRCCLLGYCPHFAPVKLK